MDNNSHSHPTVSSSVTPGAPAIQTYECLSFREHALARPEAYVGTLEVQPFSTYIVQSLTNPQNPTFVWEEFQKDGLVAAQGLSKALMTVANEIISNAVDQQRNGAKQIRIQFDPVYGDITVRDDGGGIPVERWNKSNGKVILEDHLRGTDASEMPWIPTVLFSQDKSGSKFNDEDDRTGMTGRFGYGAKATNVYCSRFQVETVDSTRQLKFVQTWHDNMSTVDFPVISKCKLKRGYTEIRFLPDYNKLLGQSFNSSVSDIFGRWLLTRAYDVVACTSKNITVFWNEERLHAKTLKEFVRAMVGSNCTIAFDEVNCPDAAVSGGHSSDIASSLQVAVVPMHESMNQDPDCRMSDDLDDHVAATPASSQTGIVGIVNGLPCSEGTLVDFIVRKIIAALKSSSKKDIKPTVAFVRRMYTIVAVATLANPSYTNVTKDRLTLASSKFGFDWNPGPAFVKKIALDHIIAALEDELQVKDNKSLLALNAPKRQRNATVVADKYDEAEDAGKRNSHCELIVTEGDSARTLAMAGLSVVGRKRYGVFALRGKPLNVRGSDAKEIAGNKEIANLMRILGLRYGDSSQKISEIRYQQITIFADQDVDGAHIFALMYNWIQTHYSHLLQQNPNFIRRFISPIMKIWPKKGKEDSPKAKYFYSLPDVQQWTMLDTKNDLNDYKVRYYKGLGSSTTVEARYYFSRIREHVVDITYTGSPTDEIVSLLFESKREDDRKCWLKKYYDPQSAVNYTVDSVSFDEFATKEYTHFCMEANNRAIPNVIDGLKPSQRKILHVFLSKDALSSDIKVSEAAGVISTEAAYHHGETSLQNAIIGMARNYVGSNNINFLVPQGQHGSRLVKDGHASARYLFTRLNPVTRLVFRPEDNTALEFINSDGKMVEPEYFVPVIPTLLVNGTNGAGVGWSCNHPSGNPYVIIDHLMQWLTTFGNDHEFPDSGSFDSVAFDAAMVPWFEGYMGTVIPDPSGLRAHVRGTWTTTVNDSQTTVHITEIPPSTWIDPFVKEWKERAADVKNLLITEVHSQSSEANVDLRIVMDSQLFQTQVDNVEKFFKLSKALNLSNRHAFDAVGQLQKYELPSDIMKAFIARRIKAYEIRKVHILEHMEKDTVIFRNKCRFVREVIARIIEPTRLLESQLTKVLEERNYEKITNSKDLQSQQNPYSYLLNMRIVSFTLDLADKLNQKLEDKLHCIKELQDCSLAKLWIKDLQELRHGIDVLYNERIADRAVHLNELEPDRRLPKKRALPQKTPASGIKSVKRAKKTNLLE